MQPVYINSLLFIMQQVSGVTSQLQSKRNVCPEDDGRRRTHDNQRPQTSAQTHRMRMQMNDSEFLQ